MDKLLRASGIVLLAIGATCANAGEQSSVSNTDQIAFVSIRDGDAHIYVTDAKGEERKLTKDGTNNGQPAWSPDGKLIAYTSNREGQPKIFIMGSDGSKPRRLSKDERIEMAASFSPDGKSIAYFSRSTDTPVVDLRITELETGKSVSVAANGDEKGPNPPKWSSDSSKLIFLAKEGRYSDVWVVDSDGKDARPISKEFNKNGKADPEFSPDSRHVTYVADMRGSMHLVTIDLVTSVARDLTPDSKAVNHSPRWSPDGKSIAFASTRDDEFNSRGDIFVMKVDGTEVRNLSKDPHEDYCPQWTADGNSIVFSSLRTGTAQVFAVDIKSSTTRRLMTNTSHDMDHTPRWVTMHQN
jgi:TolB protein